MMHRSRRPEGDYGPLHEELESPFLYESLDPPPPAEEFDDEAGAFDEPPSPDEEFEDEGEEAEWESGSAEEHRAPPCGCGARRSSELALHEAPTRRSRELLHALSDAHRALGAVLRELAREAAGGTTGESEQAELASDPLYEAEEDLDLDAAEPESEPLYEADEDLDLDEAQLTADYEQAYDLALAYGGERALAYDGERALAFEELEEDVYVAEEQASSDEREEDLDLEAPFADEAEDEPSHELAYLNESPFLSGAPFLHEATDSERENVRWAQLVLNHVEGERLDTDGKLGPLTRAALLRFQQRHGLAATGAIEARTDLALLQRGIEQTKRQSIFPSYGEWSAELAQRIAELRMSQGASMLPLFDDATRRALLAALAGASAPASVLVRSGSAGGAGSTRISIEQTIGAMLHAFSNVEVTGIIGGRRQTLKVHVPYFINRKGNTHDFAAKHRPALLALPALRALYEKEQFKRARGKASPEDIRAFLQAALDQGLVPGQATGTVSGASAKLFLRRLGLGVDCSGFVSQVLNECARALGLGAKSISVGGTNSANLKVGSSKAEFVPVTRPIDLLPGDTMWREGHIRIVHEVKRLANGRLSVIIAESSSLQSGIGPTRDSYEFGDANELTSLVQKTKRKRTYVWSRYKPLADAYARGVVAAEPLPVESTPATSSGGQAATHGLPPGQGAGPAWRHVSYAPPGVAPDPAHYRKFRVTVYHIADEADSPMTSVRVPVYDMNGKVISHVSPKFFAEMALQGSGRLRDGRLLNTTGSKNFRAVQHDEYADVLAHHGKIYTKPETRYKYGYSGLSVKGGRVVRAMTFKVKHGGAFGYGEIRATPHTPFRTLAVDMGLVTCSEAKRADGRGLVPAHTRIFIPWFKGRTMPDGTVHDGWFVAIDNGGGIYGAHFDLFAGSKSWGRALEREAKQALAQMDVWFPGIEGRIPRNYTYGLTRGDCDERRGKT